MSIPGTKIALTEENVERLIVLLNVGKKNATTAAVLQQELGLPEQRTAESVRALVLYAIVVYHYAVGSCSRGFFVIETAGELCAVLDNLDARISGLGKRREALEEAWNIRNGG